MTLKLFSCCCGGEHVVPDGLPELILQYGRNIKVTGITGEWWVPRVYLAAHGRPSDEDLAPLAHEYGWSPVNSTRRTA